MERLVNAARQPDTGVVSALTLTADSRLADRGWQLGPHGQTMPVDRFQLHEQALNFVSGAHEVSAVSLHCAVVTRSAFANVGGLDEDMDITLTHLAFSIRLRALDLKVLLDDAAVLTGLPAMLPHGIPAGAALDEFRSRHAEALAALDVYSITQSSVMLLSMQIVVGLASGQTCCRVLLQFRPWLGGVKEKSESHPEYCQTA
jgi:hypothetical protein